MTPRDYARLERLSKLATYLAHLVVEARESGDELGARRHDAHLKATCLELAPLLHAWKGESTAVTRRVRDLTDVTEEMEITEFRLRPDGRGYEPR